MHIQIDREKLHSALEIVSRVSTKHVTLPVLQSIKVTASEGKVTIEATNLEIGIIAALDAVVTETGVVAISGATLLQITHLSSAKEITIKTEGDTVLVSSDTSETTLHTFPHDEFPSIPQLEVAENQNAKEVQKDLFSLGLKTAACAVSLSSIKPELGSIFITQKQEQTLTFAATDSFRLMEKTVSQKGFTLEDSIMVPYKNALELARVCDSETANPTLIITESQCALSFPSGLYITSRLTTGSFPDYTQIIPKEYTAEVTILKQDLIQTLKKTSIFLNKFFQVRLIVSSGTLTISAQNNDVGATTESVTAATEGDEVALNFNQRYIQDALSHFQDDSITLCFSVERRMVIKGVSDTTVRYLAASMNK